MVPQTPETESTRSVNFLASAMPAEAGPAGTVDSKPGFPPTHNEPGGGTPSAA